MKTGSLWLVLVLGVCGSIGLSSARANDPQGEAAAKGSEKPEKDKLGFTGLSRADLGIYTIIVFGALVFILGKYAWKPIMAGLDKREQTILDAHEAAEKARAEAREALAKIQKQLAETNDQVRGMIEEARRDGQALKDTMKAEASRDAQAERERSRREIETARDQALQEIWSQAVQLATLISTKAVHREMSIEDHRRLVAESLVQLKQTMSA